MQQALELAESGVGQCAPNPTVGCVIVKDNEIIGQARTANGGRPHAETQALSQADDAAKGATAYVTLEPCAHHGQTPPCAEALVDAGITKVIIAITDPYPKVNGGGIAALKAAGIEVEVGNGAEQAIEINRGFISRVKRLRPWVTLKTATTTDGFIAQEDGTSKWITGEAARENGHLLRSRNDAILTGSGTYLFDKPQLTVRVQGLEGTSPTRHVLDRRGRIQSSEFRVRKEENLAELLRNMATEGINYLMVEAGAALSQSFLEQGLIDELYWYRAPKQFGKGIAAFNHAEKSLNLERFKMNELSLGDDRLTIYRFTNPQSLIGD